MVEILAVWFGAYFVFMCYMALFPDARHLVGKQTTPASQPAPKVAVKPEPAYYQPVQQGILEPR